MNLEDSNPAQGVSSPSSGESDNWVLSFYDTDDPDNTKDDSVIEREYELTKKEMDEFEEKMKDAFGPEYMEDLGPTFQMMLYSRTDLYEILDEVKGNE